MSSNSCYKAKDKNKKLTDQLKSFFAVVFDFDLEYRMATPLKTSLETSPPETSPPETFPPDETSLETSPPETSPPGPGAPAYEHLKSKLSEQCLRYFAFHQNQIFGCFPGMYKENEWKENIPGDLVSDYFRGGIISSIAIFEAFIVDLLKEACDCEAANIKNKNQANLIKRLKQLQSAQKKR